MSSVIKVYNERQQSISVKNDTPPPTLQETVIESNGVFMPEKGYVGFGEVTVNVPPYGEGEVEITSNGTHNVSGKAVANVNVPSADSLIDNSITEIESGVKTIEVYKFYGCYKLRTANFPLATSISAYAFQNCNSLVTANFPKMSYIGSYAFLYCYSLTKVIIGTTQVGVSTLSSKNAFNNCYHILGTVNATYNPNGDKDGFIYVNASLVAQYRTATNWTTYASQIMPWVATIDELASIDGTLYDHACVGETEYVYNGVGWVEFIRGEV